MAIRRCCAIKASSSSQERERGAPPLRLPASVLRQMPETIRDTSQLESHPAEDAVVFTDVQGLPPEGPKQPHGRDYVRSTAISPGKDGTASGGPPRPAQRLPANQRAPEREERLVNVGPLVIPHSQAAKLTEPGKGALHDPPPPPQATPMRGAAHGQERHDVTRPQPTPNRRRVVTAIPEDTVRPLPRSPAFAVQRGNRIHQRQNPCATFSARRCTQRRRRHDTGSDD